MNLLKSMRLIRPWFRRIGRVRQLSHVGTDDSQVIDFREIAGRYTFAEHAARADEYFAKLDLRSVVARKPFAAPAEAAELCGGIAALLPSLHLYSGARVLDFGAGTCWMARLLALLGCEVTAVDVSRRALEIGEQLIRSDPLADHLKVRFVPLDGPQLPFADASFDRVVCFDALHHVPDQNEAIREFGRVLTDGGIAALHEPGPMNSRSSQAQFEMRMYEVIEGDVHVEELVETARATGFTGAEIAVYASAIKTNLGGFNDFLGNPGTSAVGSRFIAHTAAGCENRRTFFLYKGDPFAGMDSRSPHGLLAAIELSARLDDAHTIMQGTISNLGSNTWRPSFGTIGAVNIGVHLRGADGRMINGEYGRFLLSTDKVAPGQSRVVEMRIPHPPDLDRFELVVDLVAEHVAWFEVFGGSASRFLVRLDDVPHIERIA